MGIGDQVAAQIGQGQSLGHAAGGSRLTADIGHVTAIAKNINAARDRVIGHTALLGYLPATPAGALDPGKVQPISNTLQSALGDLDRAVDGLHTALAMLDA